METAANMQIYQQKNVCRLTLFSGRQLDPHLQKLLEDFAWSLVGLHKSFYLFVEVNVAV